MVSTFCTTPLRRPSYIFGAWAPWAGCNQGRTSCQLYDGTRRLFLSARSFFALLFEGAAHCACSGPPENAFKTGGPRSQDKPPRQPQRRTARTQREAPDFFLDPQGRCLSIPRQEGSEPARFFGHRIFSVTPRKTLSNPLDLPIRQPDWDRSGPPYQRAEFKVPF